MSAAIVATECPEDPVEAFEWEFTRKRAIVLSLLGEQNDPTTPQTDRVFATASAKYRAILNEHNPKNPTPDPFSVVDCILQASQLGLEAGSDQAYLVPYAGKVQFIVSPRGLIDLAFRHPLCKDINADVVREGDYFDYMLGDDPFIKHRKADKRGALTHAYAVMTLTTGGKIRSVLTRSEVEFYRGFSKASSDKSPWYTNEAAMWKKTAIKRMMGQGPRSPQMVDALRENDRGHYIAAGVDPVTEPAGRSAAFVGHVFDAPRLPPAVEHVVIPASAFDGATVEHLHWLLAVGREADQAEATELAFAARIARLAGEISESDVGAVAKYDTLASCARAASLASGAAPVKMVGRALAAARARLGIATVTP